MSDKALTTIHTIPPSTLTTAQVFDIWLADQESEATRRTYFSEVKAFQEWVKKPAQAVHIGDVVAYKEHLASQGLEPVTIAKKLSTLRSFYKFAHAQGLTPTNPTQGVKLPKVRQETTRDILSLAEVDKLFSQVNTDTLIGKRDLAILGLLLVNGLREIEVTRANVGDLKEIEGIRVLVVHGKGGREDETVLRADVHQAIMAYLEARGDDLKAGDPLFVGTNHRAGKRLNTRTIRARIEHYLEGAGIRRPGISGHSFRHTAITWPILAGATFTQAMELARHTDPRMTKRYFHNLDKLRNHAVNLSPVGLGAIS